MFQDIRIEKWVAQIVPAMNLKKEDLLPLQWLYSKIF